MKDPETLLVKTSKQKTMFHTSMNPPENATWYQIKHHKIRLWEFAKKMTPAL